MNITKSELITIVAKSQDGNPRKSLEKAAENGSLISMPDDLDSMLAHLINNVIETEDIESMRSELSYAIKQLQAALAAIDLI